MAITTDHIVGAAVGVGLAAAGYYFYRKNQDKVDQFLRDHGMNIPVREGKPLATMNIEELATLKERVEDLLAEREAAAKAAAEVK
ncbi:MAG TPA: hypothetical protein DER26_05010 [Verrucomicrobia bacterium]|nr:hypothetical protein [Verrucomicrobiota bacterium]